MSAGCRFVATQLARNHRETSFPRERGRRRQLVPSRLELVHDLDRYLQRLKAFANTDHRTLLQTLKRGGSIELDRDGPGLHRP